MASPRPSTPFPYTHTLVHGRSTSYFQPHSATQPRSSQPLHFHMTRMTEKIPLSLQKNSDKKIASRRASSSQSTLSDSSSMPVSTPRVSGTEKPSFPRVLSSTPSCASSQSSPESTASMMPATPPSSYSPATSFIIQTPSSMDDADQIGDVAFEGWDEGRKERVKDRSKSIAFSLSKFSDRVLSSNKTCGADIFKFRTGMEQRKTLTSMVDGGRWEVVG
ncbi:hypothetical protein L204_104258 [Cryptococcus depauperatus]